MQTHTLTVRSSPPWRAMLLAAAAYYAGVEIGMAFTLTPHPVSTLWPPNAILFAVLLLTPTRWWWLMILGVLPAHVVAEVSSGVPVVMALAWFVSNVCEALIGAAGVRRFVDGPIRLDNQRQLGVFLMFAFVAPLISSFLDAAFVLWVGGGGNDYWTVFGTRFLSNALAMLTVAPVVIALGSVTWDELRRAMPHRYLELAILTAALLVLAFLVFHLRPQSSVTLVLLYVLTPPLIWAALRFDARIVSALILAVALIAIDAAVNGSGPFEAGTLLENARAVQLFLIAAAVPILALVAVTQDRARVRQLAQANQERLSLALEAAQLGTWAWDLRRDRVAWCDVSKRMFDAPEAASELPFPAFIAAVSAEDRPMVVAGLRTAIAQQAPYDLRFRVSTRRRGTRWIVAKGKVALDHEGRCAQVLGINIDVTERVRGEEQQQEQRQQLAHLGRVSVMGELSGALAHELNQPLTAIMSNAQAARRNLEQGRANVDDLRETLEDIITEDRRASAVIDRMRTLLKRGRLSYEAVDVNDTIRTVLALDRGDLLAHKVAVQLNLMDVPAVTADCVQLQQVLLNLVVNARDAVGSNDPADRVIDVATKRGSEDRVEISIADNGEGIAEEHRAKVFEAFFSTKQHGLGFGLAICRTIVTAHHGRLWFTSNSARGTTFRLSLPVHRACSAEQMLAKHAADDGRAC